MPFTCSFVNDITNSGLLFFMDLSVMVPLLLLMSLIWNVRIMFYVAELSASEHLFEISAI